MKYPVDFVTACEIMNATNGSIISEWRETEYAVPITYHFDGDCCLVDNNGDYAILDIFEIRSKWRNIMEGIE